ncbi:acyl-CoA dehydrogenase family protein [Paenibacillus sp. N4]|uniref:acyl-CoA dehydrogenase family protein n=1 Tax=Paenibacillus vietnamensis TaxID=2590547 RepID=UPI0021E4AE40|nr:acyl-CoA dehydrogenase family protein [Paenibacillus vietnamensis]MCA0754300.1 acyl-CoA dehydrogenase family protein [Paenibacillus vietnamensis]
MQFGLTEEQELTREVVRDFAEQAVAAGAGSRDEEGRFRRELFAQLAQLGLAGIPVSEKYGGAGSDLLTYAIVLEELARVCSSTAAALAAHTAYCVWPLQRFGGEELRRMLLPELAGGAKLGGCALHAAHAGQTGAAACLRSLQSGTVYRLIGTQPSAMNAPQADYMLVAAQGHDGRSKTGVQFFLVDTAGPLIEVGEPERKLGLRSFATAPLILRGYEATGLAQIGNESNVKELVEAIADIGQISAAAMAVGAAQGALEAAAGYAKERKQFGKPIARQQGIAFKLADMSARIDASRLLAYQAAWLMDEGKSCGKEAAMARKYAAETAVAAGIEAVQIFGGSGYMREFRMERFLRDAKCLESDFGTGGLNSDMILRILAE